jgi:hypothetical protein
MGVLLLFFLLLGWLVCSWLNNTASVSATMTGILLAWLFVGTGFIGSYMARLKQAGTFYRIFISTIFGRLAVMTLVLFLVLKYADLPNIPFIISMFCGYFAFQLWELVSFHRLKTEEL